MVQAFVANCKPHNWDACERDTIFGLKLGRTLPPLQQGDLILLRITGPDYGVRAIWYFDQAVQVNSGVRVPWTDGQYGWILRCKPIIKLPRLFDEDFRTSSKLSSKIPDFPATRIQPSIIHLKHFEIQAYIQHLLQEFESDLHVTFDYLGSTKSVDGFLEEILASIDRKEPAPVSRRPLPISVPQPETPESPTPRPPVEYPQGGTPYGTVGERVDLPILNYAPLNESGVILLFGYYLQDLGFSHIEEIRQGFPDAIGMRSVGSGKYKRIRIEFEFRSSSFIAHKHPIEGCDVIVCWEHDWQDCPLEVIELRTALFETSG